MTRRLFRWASSWQPSGRQQLAAYVVIVAAFAGGMWRVEATSRQVAREAEARAAAQCEGALAEREEDREILVTIVTRAGARQEMIDLVNESFDERPLPAACEER